eukprot:3941047-Rhodomonas_salina.2
MEVSLYDICHQQLTLILIVRPRMDELGHHVRRSLPPSLRGWLRWNVQYIWHDAALYQLRITSGQKTPHVSV